MKLFGSLNRVFLFAGTIFVWPLLVSNSLLAQGDFPGGGGGGGVPQPTQIPQQTQFPQQQQQGGGQGGGGGGQGGGNQTSQGGPVDIDPRSAVQFNQIPDTRNQGFVGATASKINERGFVGASTDLSGPAIATGATFGGGVNSTGGGAGGARRATGGGGGGNFGANQFGQGVGSQNFFEVPRGGLRGAVTLNFTVPVVTDGQIVNQFSTNFSRLPDYQEFSGQYQVSVNDKRATVSGWVRSTADSDRLIAQLRLQPGIYEIENNLEIGDR